MNRDVPLKKYAKKMNHSYTFGAFPTIELLKNQPEHVLKVLLHPDMNSETQLEIITDLCNRHNIPIERAAKVVEKLRDKENIFAVGVFEKYTNQLDPTADHIVLVNPSDMGNMGNISRMHVMMCGPHIYHPHIEAIIHLLDQFDGLHIRIFRIANNACPSVE